MIYARGEVFFEEKVHYKVISKKESQSFKGPRPLTPSPEVGGGGVWLRIPPLSLCG